MSFAKMVAHFDPRALELEIRNIAETASRSAAREMRKAAIKIRDLARDNAPHKTGNLEDAIQWASYKDPATRRNVYVVYVDDGMVTRRGYDYAQLMEEGLAPAGDRYNLGEGSIKKLWSGKKVGGRFLQRAVTDGAKGIIADANAAVARVLGGRVSNLTGQFDEMDGDE